MKGNETGARGDGVDCSDPLDGDPEGDAYAFVKIFEKPGLTWGTGDIKVQPEYQIRAPVSAELVKPERCRLHGKQPAPAW